MDCVPKNLVEPVFREVLKDVTERDGAMRGQLELTLLACEKVVFPTLRPWFVEQLKSISDGNPGLGDLINRLIVHAAVVQVPGVAAGRESWIKLLRNPRYSHLAFLTLGHEWLERLHYLELFWNSGNERRDDVLLKMASELPADICSEFIKELQHIGANWPLELRLAVNLAFGKFNHPPVFRPMTS